MKRSGGRELEKAAIDDAESWIVAGKSCSADAKICSGSAQVRIAAGGHLER
jgi:hypothetical protein